MTKFSTISLEYNKPVENVATLTFNRPEALNAVNINVVRDLELAVSELEINEHNIRCLVLTGAGDRAFVAGADISKMAVMSPAEARNFLHSFQQVLNRVEQLSFPVIAKINGYALGGGLEIALACDIRIASEKARVGLPEVSLGIIPAAGGTQRLTRLVGQGISKYLILTGKQLKADDAQEMGILSEVVDADELDDKTETLIQTLLNMGPVALAAAKRSIEVALNESLNSGLEIELNNAIACFRSEDLREGMTAFIEKRRANFTGK